MRVEGTCLGVVRMFGVLRLLMAWRDAWVHKMRALPYVLSNVGLRGEWSCVCGRDGVCHCWFVDFLVRFRLQCSWNRGVIVIFT